MNRYQREVAEMDRRQRLVMRGLSFLGAAMLIIATLWAAGFPPGEWWMRVHAWMARHKSSIAAPSASQASADGAPTPSADVAAADPAVRGIAGTDSSVSLTPQPLYLIATSPGRNWSEGTAQIGTRPENPQTYSGGATLVNGARIAEIHREFVVLTRGAQSARLELYQRDKPQRTAGNDLLQVGGKQLEAPPTPELRVAITSYLRPNPVFDGETLRGVEVYPGPRSAVFHRFGLQAGDVITALDDAPLLEPGQAFEVLGQLTTGQAMVATVDRKGAKQRITLDGALIIADQEAAQRPAEQLAGPGLPPG